MSNLHDNGGLRYDVGKNRLDLIPPEWVWELGRVLSRGATKYSDRNWERGMKWSKVWGPMLRHAFRWLAGERFDEESGCHHLAAVAWNALALMTYDMRHIGQDDLRYRGGYSEDWLNDPVTLSAPQADEAQMKSSRGGTSGRPVSRGFDGRDGAAKTPLL